MTERKILKEVDSFLEQAKLDGEISGSSSNLSIEIQKQRQNNNFIELTEVDRKSRIEYNIVNKDSNDKHVTNIINYVDEEKIDKTKKTSIYEIPDDKENVLNNVSVQSNGNDVKSSHTSFIDLGSVNNKCTSYVHKCQIHKNGCSISNFEDYSNSNEKTRLLEKVQEVNSALFWERWIDKIFQIFDRWMNNSSDSEDNDVRRARSYSTFDINNRAFTTNSTQPNKSKSEPAVRTTYFSHNDRGQHLQYKCPSYVDWLSRIRKQQEPDVTASDTQTNESYRGINAKQPSKIHKKGAKSLQIQTKLYRNDFVGQRAKTESMNRSSSSSSESITTLSKFQKTKLYSSRKHKNKIRNKQLSKESKIPSTKQENTVESKRNASRLESELSDTFSSLSQEDINRIKSFNKFLKRNQ